VETTQSIPFREVERTIKIHEVMLKAMAKKVSWLSAAEIIGIVAFSVQPLSPSAHRSRRFDPGLPLHKIIRS